MPPSSSHPVIITLSQFSPLSPEAQADLTACLTHLTLPKGEVLLRAGSTCRHIHFVVSGFARGVYHDEHGREFTSWFWSEGDIMTSFESLLRQSPSEENIELLEPTEVYRLGYTDLQRFYATYPEFERLGRHFAEDAFLRAGRLNTFLRMSTAKERYLALIGRYPQLLERSYLKYIASYLGVSRETLSRIRNDKG